MNAVWLRLSGYFSVLPWRSSSSSSIKPKTLEDEPEEAGRNAASGQTLVRILSRQWPRRAVIMLAACGAGGFPLAPVARADIE